MTQEKVTVLVKDPTREWDEPVEVFDEKEAAEEARNNLGLDPTSMTQNAQVIPDVPYHKNVNE